MNGGWLIKCFGAVFVAAMAVLYIPILAVAIYAFFPVSGGAVDLSAPTLTFFSSIAANSSVVEALANSAIAAVLSTVLSLTFATGYATFLRAKPPVFRAAFEALIFAPFFLPPIIVGLSLLLASSSTGFPRGMATIVVGHSLFTLAIVYKIISVRLANLPASLQHASADLGASKWQTIRYITFPHLRSAFVAAALLAMLMSFDETLITALVSGDTTTLPLRLWAMMRVGFSPSINALVVVVLAICICLSLSIFAALSRGQRATS
jgi:ABC-type spermidine/putrescine transport system permease subunit II